MKQKWIGLILRALEEISGEYGALEVINSGSVFELQKNFRKN